MYDVNKIVNVCEAYKCSPYVALKILESAEKNGTMESLLNSVEKRIGDENNE